ncbi:hypothetical protein B484DRAFT_444396 [Ochromonadaceae sp. CCMP2298]|nr:hypothetical protein B484DRAFT_444396 [Ochromonadaceae sp. CCMP2298]
MNHSFGCVSKDSEAMEAILAQITEPGASSSVAALDGQAVELVVSLDALGLLNAACVQSNAFRGRLYGALSWEMFDKLFALALGASAPAFAPATISTPSTSNASGAAFALDPSLRNSLADMAKHVRPRAVHLMVAEKLASCSGVRPLRLLSCALLFALQRDPDEKAWQRGLALLLRRAAALGEQRKQSAADVLHCLLLLGEGLGAAADPTQESLLVGFVTRSAGRLLPLVEADALRCGLGARALCLVMALTSDLEGLFRRIYTARYEIYREERAAALRQHRAEYCNRQGEDRSAHQLSTRDANALLNRVAQSEYAEALVQYFDAVDGALLSAQTSQTRGSGDGGDERKGVEGGEESAVSVDWWLCVGWGSVTEQRCYQTDRAQARLRAAEEAAAKGKKGLEEEEGALTPSVTGLAFLAYALLACTSSKGTDTPLSPPLPPLSPAYLRLLLRPYALLLLRLPVTAVAACEGLRLATLSYEVSQIPCLTLPLCRSPLCMVFLAQNEPAALLSHLVLASNQALPLIPIEPMHTNTGNTRVQAFWSAGGAAKLCCVSAASSDALATAQGLVSAMAQCADDEWRSRAFSALRAFLRQVEERSLFTLLVALVEDCPYPNIAGLLIDMAKECAQAAAPGPTSTPASVSAPASVSVSAPSWCTVRLERSGNSVRVVGSAVGGSGGGGSSGDRVDSWAPAGWLRECYADSALLKPFPLSHVLLPTTTTTTGGDSSEVDVDCMLLAGGEGDGEEEGEEGRGCFLDLRSGSTRLPQEKATELREAAPFMWGGRSPFWSPLLLDRFVLGPLRDYADLPTEKLREGVDVISARVSLLLFVVLRLNAELAPPPPTHTPPTHSLPLPAQSAADSHPPVPPSTSASPASALPTPALDEFFSGAALFSSQGAGEGAGPGQRGEFPFAYSKLRAVRDVFQAYFQLRELKQQLRRCTGEDKDGRDRDEGAGEQGRGPEMEEVRVLLLRANVDHLLQQLRLLCNALYQRLHAAASRTRQP